MSKRRKLRKHSDFTNRKLAGEAAEACVQNFRQLLDSSDSLAREGRFPHAFALSALAYQEIGKTMLWREVEGGLYEVKPSPDPRYRGDTWNSDDGDQFLDPGAFTSHDGKASLLGTSMIGYLMGELIFKGEGMREREGLLLDVAFELFQKAEDQGDTPSFPTDTPEGRYAQMVWSFVRFSRDYYNWTESLEARRRDALYVDVRHGRVITPSSTTESDYRQLREFVERVLKNLSHMITKPLDPREVARARPVVAHNDEEFTSKYLDYLFGP